MELDLDKETAAKRFVVEFLGTLAMFGADPSKVQVLQLIRKDGVNASTSSINDSYGDFLKSLKNAVDAGIIKSMTAKALLKLVNSIVTRASKELDETLLYDIISGVPFIQINLKGKYRQEFIKYKDGSITLYQMIYKLRTPIQQDSFDDEFIKLFKKCLLSIKAAAKVFTKDEVDQIAIEEAEEFLDNQSILSMEDYEIVSNTVEVLDSVLTDEIIDQAEFYDIEEDEDTLITTVRLFDENEQEIITIEVDDYDIALGYLEDIFEIDSEDDEDWEQDFEFEDDEE